MRPKHTCINIVAAAGAVTFLTAESLAVQKFSGWSEPVNLGPLVNSEFSDTYPAVSQKGLSLYFASNRPGSLGVDLWVARRASVDHPWEPPVNVGPNVNTSSVEDAPAISRDGHWLFFDSTRPDGHGALDLWVSWRAHTDDDFGWLPAVNLGAGINTNVLDAGPAPLENGDARMPLLFFVSNRAGGIGFNDIYVSRGDGDGPYTAGTPVTELNSPQGEFRPTIRYDGLEIVFGSNRPASLPGSALWTSHRTRVDEPWSPPVELGPPVNGGFFEGSPYLSRDGRALYFSAVRPDRIGGFDLYVSTRSRNTGR